MSVSKINPVYQVNSKQENDTLSATEWNNISSAVNTALTKINEILDEGVPSGGGSSTPSSDSHITMNNKGNLNIVTTSADQVNNKGAKINIEPYSDLQIKPGDDITLYSHHREEDKREEVAVKIMNGAELTVNGTKLGDYPVDLQVNAANVKFTTKDKETYITNENIRRSAAGKGNTSDAQDILNMEIKTGVKSENASRSNPEYGYLKIRARAIDLRCEEHGGIALQPKGTDAQGHINKIKFEHGGGDGLEFGTFNTEKTSLFTDEYRFNKDGIWKMATRIKEASDKPSANDSTTTYKYLKQTDDFYDVISGTDETATTRDIIKTASALNGNNGVHTHITSKNNLEIATINKWILGQYTSVSSDAPEYDNSIVPLFTDFGAETETIDFEVPHTFDEIATYLFADFPKETADTMRATLLSKLVDKNGKAQNYTLYVTSQASGGYEGFYTLVDYVAAPDINLESDSNIELKAGANIEIKAANKLALKGILDFGSNFGFGETDEGIEVQYKLTKNNATKDCGVVKVVGYNNSTSQDLTVEGVTINRKADKDDPVNTATIAQCSILDIIKLVNYFKTGAGQANGPWAAQL